MQKYGWNLHIFMEKNLLDIYDEVKLWDLIRSSGLFERCKQRVDIQTFVLWNFLVIKRTGALRCPLKKKVKKDVCTKKQCLYTWYAHLWIIYEYHISKHKKHMMFRAEQKSQSNFCVSVWRRSRLEGGPGIALQGLDAAGAQLRRITSVAVVVAPRERETRLVDVDGAVWWHEGWTQFVWF